MVLMSDSKVPKEGEILNGQLWFSRRGNILTLGLTSAGIETLGDLNSIELPEDGDHFDSGDTVFTVEGNQGSIEFATPSKGVIVEANPSGSNIDIVQEDPLEEGWFVKIQMDDLESFMDLV